MDEKITQASEKKTGVVSMRLRPQEQTMFRELAEAYNFYGDANAVRAAGRILVMLNLSMEDLLTALADYERLHPECEPVHFRPVKTEET